MYRKMHGSCATVGAANFFETELSCPMSQLPLGNLTQSRGEPERVPGIGLAAVAARTWPIITILTLRNACHATGFGAALLGIQLSSVRMRLTRCRPSRCK